MISQRMLLIELYRRCVKPYSPNIHYYPRSGHDFWTDSSGAEDWAYKITRCGPVFNELHNKWLDKYETSTSDLRHIAHEIRFQRDLFRKEGMNPFRSTIEVETILHPRIDNFLQRFSIWTSYQEYQCAMCLYRDLTNGIVERIDQWWELNYAHASLSNMARKGPNVLRRIGTEGKWVYWVRPHSPLFNAIEEKWEKDGHELMYLTKMSKLATPINY